MVVGFITTFAISAYQINVVSSNHATTYVIKFVSDFRQVGGFLRVLQFPPPIKLTALI